MVNFQVVNITGVCVSAVAHYSSTMSILERPEMPGAML